MSCSNCTRLIGKRLSQQRKTMILTTTTTQAWDLGVDVDEEMSVYTSTSRPRVVLGHCGVVLVTLNLTLIPKHHTFTLDLTPNP